MKQYPPIPEVGSESAPDFEGHLWLLEAVEGSVLRFRLRESGAIRFGGPRRPYRDDEVPRACRRAVRHVRERLDRGALRDAVDDVTAYTFVGRATHRERIDYDWGRLPPFLGLDVCSADEGPRPPDAAEGIFERLGLSPVNAVEREVRARDFDPERYEMPASAWYDGPAAGVVIRDKRGNRAQLKNLEISEPSEGSIPAADATELAERIATDQRFERVVTRLRDRGWEPSVDELCDRVLADAYRDEHGRLFGSDAPVEETALRTAVARRAGAFLG